MISKLAKLLWVLVIGLCIGGDEGWCQKPLEVTPCQLKTDPPTYNHKIGRFFAGKRVEFFEGKPWGGFGHFSCCTLLAIQEVETADTENHPKLDYGSSPEQPHLLERAGCSFRELLSVDQSALLAWQREVDDGKHSWAIDDPKRVALEALSHVEHINMSSMKNLKLSKEEQGQKVYLCQPGSNLASYMVVVSRPYWLSFYAHDANRVAWAAIAAYESSCDTANAVPPRSKMSP